MYLTFRRYDFGRRGIFCAALDAGVDRGYGLVASSRRDSEAPRRHANQFVRRNIR
jgi:hypothetical protein